MGLCNMRPLSYCETSQLGFRSAGEAWNGLLRRLIVHPSRPGILYLHYWPAARYKSFYDNDETSLTPS